MAENKQKILDLLVPVFREINMLYGIVRMEYDEKRELIYVHYASGYIRCIDAFMEDTGVDMLRRLMQALP